MSTDTPPFQKSPSESPPLAVLPNTVPNGRSKLFGKTHTFLSSCRLVDTFTVRRGGGIEVAGRDTTECHPTRSRRTERGLNLVRGWHIANGYCNTLGCEPVG